MTTTAYRLGCKYASAVSEGGKALAERFLASRPAQYVAGGLGGAGVGALLGGEDNRLRGAVLGAGAGLGATGLGRMGARMGQRSVSTDRVYKTLLERGLEDRPRNLEMIRNELERRAAIRGIELMAPFGALAGGSLARPFAPSHKEKSWYDRLHG